MIVRTRAGLLLAAALCVAPAITLAAEEQGDAHGDGHGDGHGSHPHHVSLTVGAADNGHLDETGLSIGAEYRYALNDRFAIGPMLDYTTYDHEDTTLLVAALFWRPQRLQRMRMTASSRSGSASATTSRWGGSR